MAWARFDDSFPDHPKICALSDAAFRVEVAAIIYAARFSTDGRIPDGAIGKLHPDPAVAKSAIADLVEGGLMERSGRGYIIHDYLDWNPSRATLEKIRADRASAGQIGGTAAANAKAKRQQNSSNILIPSETSPDPDPIPTDPRPKDPETLPPGGGAVTGKPRAKNSSWSAEACDDWTARMASPANGGKIGRSLKPLVDKHTWATVRPAWQRYLAETDAEFTSPSRFAETIGKWNGTAAARTGGGRFDKPTPTEIYNTAAAAVERALKREKEAEGG